MKKKKYRFFPIFPKFSKKISMTFFHFFPIILVFFGIYTCFFFTKLTVLQFQSFIYITKQTRSRYAENSLHSGAQKKITMFAVINRDRQNCMSRLCGYKWREPERVKVTSILIKGFDEHALKYQAPSKSGSVC